MNGGREPMRSPYDSFQIARRVHGTTHAAAYLVSQLLQRAGVVAQPGCMRLQCINLRIMQLMMCSVTVTRV